MWTVASTARRAFAAAALMVAFAWPAAAAAVTPLVSPQWLNDRLGDPAILVLDIRSAIDGGATTATVQANGRSYPLWEAASFASGDGVAYLNLQGITVGSSRLRFRIICTWPVRIGCESSASVSSTT